MHEWDSASFQSSLFFYCDQVALLFGFECTSSIKESSDGEKWISDKTNPLSGWDLKLQLVGVATMRKKNWETWEDCRCWIIWHLIHYFNDWNLDLRFFCSLLASSMSNFCSSINDCESTLTVLVAWLSDVWIWFWRSFFLVLCGCEDWHKPYSSYDSLSHLL